MAKRPFKSVRPNADSELNDTQEGLDLCESIMEECRELEDEDLDAFQETTVTKAKAFASSVSETIERTGVFTEGQRGALENWQKGVVRVREQLERKRR